MQRYDEAIADLNAAIHINPAQAESLYLRGLARLAKGQAADGARDIDDALALEPDVQPY